MQVQHAEWQLVTGVSEVLIASVFRKKQSKNLVTYVGLTNLISNLVNNVLNDL
jgi:hypothetical protein